MDMPQGILCCGVASITKSHVRVSDIVARYGGEEFIILLPETIAADAADVAENLRWRIEDSSVDGGKYLIRITAVLESAIISKNQMQNQTIK